MPFGPLTVQILCVIRSDVAKDTLLSFRHVFVHIFGLLCTISDGALPEGSKSDTNFEPDS
jgi:hypothetical protein